MWLYCGGYYFPSYVGYLITSTDGSCQWYIAFLWNFVHIASGICFIILILKRIISSVHWHEFWGSVAIFSVLPAEAGWFRGMTSLSSDCLFIHHTSSLVCIRGWHMTLCSVVLATVSLVIILRWFGIPVWIFWIDGKHGWAVFFLY